ncbi:DUF2478 domain-containing protein [Phaeovulum sp. NW3]|uniref:DUF2478 domain-containing protein n=1 Tax=Phaeovulum sp. NW3 TaxID=2934933 RepID=UPI002021D6E7|nr:DUF2478 domain-containing protein [Phaeovulum sp. NW3]MCL7464306.1 DUF2478 domain-containing protein [Phaeovulum sp. NW3]
MLGYVVADGRGAADRLLAAVARRLQGDGWPLAGAVQVNVSLGPGARSAMDLHLLRPGAGPEAVVRISQDLGALSQGCRLDPAALAQAAGLIEAALDAGPRLLIANKFGKAEAEGGGLRPAIGLALARGIPVLTAVAPKNLPAFEAFAGEFGESLPAEVAAVLDWCHRT